MGKSRIDATEIKAIAEGRWTDILPAVAGISIDLLDGSHHPCPMLCSPNAGGKDRFRAIDIQQGALFCNRCQSEKCGDGFATIQWLNKCTFPQAVEAVAQYLGETGSAKTGSAKPRTKSKGVEPVKKKQMDMSKLRFEPWDDGRDRLLALWCMKKKPIRLETVKKCGGKWGRHHFGKKDFAVVALPVWGEQLNAAGPVGWAMLPDGRGLPCYAGKGKPPKIEKVKLLEGSDSKTGLIGDVDLLAESHTIIKAEGLSDYLALKSIELPAGYAVITNPSGAKQGVAPWIVDALAGKTVYIVHDCDRPGQDGAITFNDAISETSTVLNVDLGAPIAEKDGFDFRDWVNKPENREKPVEKFLELIADAKPIDPTTLTDVPESKSDRPKTQTQYRPKMLSLSEFVEANPVEPDPIIFGLLRAGEVANIISMSKQGKSFLCLSLAFAVAFGKDFLGMKTRKGRVLILDSEVQPGSLAKRIQDVARELGISLDDVGKSIIIEALRVDPLSIGELPTIYGDIEPGDFALIIIDPLYKLWPEGFNENDNAQMGHVYAKLSRWATSIETGISIVHHPAKGDTSERTVADAGSGAGSFARACDTQIVIYNHAESNGQDGLCVIEAVTRTFAKPAPASIIFQYPLWRTWMAPAKRATRENIKRANAEKSVAANAQAIENAFSLFDPGKKVQRCKLQPKTGLSKDKFESGISKLIQDKKVERFERYGRKADGKKSKRVNVFYQLLAKTVDLSGQVVGLEVGPTKNPTSRPDNMVRGAFIYKAPSPCSPGELEADEASKPDGSKESNSDDSDSPLDEWDWNDVSEGVAT